MTYRVLLDKLQPATIESRSAPLHTLNPGLIRIFHGGDICAKVQRLLGFHAGGCSLALRPLPRLLLPRAGLRAGRRCELASTTNASRVKGCERNEARIARHCCWANFGSLAPDDLPCDVEQRRGIYGRLRHGSNQSIRPHRHAFSRTKFHFHYPPSRRSQYRIRATTDCR